MKHLLISLKSKESAHFENLDIYKSLQIWMMLMAI